MHGLMALANLSATLHFLEMTDNQEIRAEVRLATTDLRADLGFFTKVLKMRMDSIYPADDPSVAVFSGHGLRVRLQTEGGAGHLAILTDDPAR